MTLNLGTVGVSTDDTYGELQAERQIPMSMEEGAKELDDLLEFNGNKILTGADKASCRKRI